MTTTTGATLDQKMADLDKTLAVLSANVENMAKGM